MKYFNLAAELRNKGWDTEVGLGGLVTIRHKKPKYDTLKKHDIKAKKSQIYKDVSRISLVCLFVSFTSPPLDCGLQYGLRRLFSPTSSLA